LMFDLTPEFFVMLEKRRCGNYRVEKNKITHKFAKASRSRPPS
jgi:hypothetical protein